MFKKIIILSSILICSIIFISCEKGGTNDSTTKTTIVSTKIPTSIDTSSTSSFDILYQGFISVDVDEADDYYMTDNYIITNETDWNTWNSKYTSAYPYYLEDIGMDWDKECLVVYAYYGAKDFYTTIGAIENVSFSNNKVTISTNEDDVTSKTYAFNGNDNKNIAFYVIRIDKPENLKSLDSHYFKYTTHSQTNK